MVRYLTPFIISPFFKNSRMALPPPAETVLGHNSLPSELAGEVVLANRSPARFPVFGKARLKISLIAEHHLLPVLYPPVQASVGKGKLQVLHSLAEELLGCIFLEGRMRFFWHSL
jgi:hypothetical protein